MSSHVDPPGAPQPEPQPLPDAAPLRRMGDRLLLALILASSIVLVALGCEGNPIAGVHAFHNGFPSTSSLQGQVYSLADGAPIAGARVIATGAGQSISDPGGNYDLPAIPPGPIGISVFAQGFVTQTQGMVIAAGGTIRQDITMAPFGVVGTLTGTALDAASGLPAPKVLASVVDHPITSTSDITGRFVLAGIPAGRRTVLLSDASHQPVTASVAIPPEGQTFQTFLLNLATGAIQGVVSTTFGGGGTLDGATVSVAGTSLTTVTAGGGLYGFTNLRHGKYLLLFSAPSHDPTDLTTTVLTGQTIESDATLRFNRASLHGTVVDGTSDVGIVGALVSVPSQDLTTVTTSGGEWSLANVIRVANPPQSIAVGAAKSGFIGAGVFATPNPGDDVAVTIQIFQSVGNMQGTVVANSTSLAIPGALVAIPLTGQATFSDIGGAFSFLSLPPSTYQVNVTAAGFSTLTTFVPVVGNETTTVQIRMR